MLNAAGHEEAEQLERAIVKDFRNDLKGHKERLQQSHRVRNMLEIMQERANKLVCHAVQVKFCRAPLQYTKGIGKSALATLSEKSAY